MPAERGCFKRSCALSIRRIDDVDCLLILEDRHLRAKALRGSEGALGASGQLGLCACGNGLGLLSGKHFVRIGLFCGVCVGESRQA